MSTQVTVIVCTYNSDRKKTLATIRSVLTQKGVSYSIIVADDGSEQNYFSDITQLFSEFGFTDYKLLALNENRGTVLNVLNAMRYVRSEIVKPISPGDYFYDDYVLFKIVSSMRDDIQFCFGKKICYQADGKSVKLIASRSPGEKSGYCKKDGEIVTGVAKRRLVRYGEFISGACAAYRSDAFRNCLQKLAFEVMFSEDFALRLMLLDGFQGIYIDDWLIWYEYNAGVSHLGSRRIKFTHLVDYDGLYRVLEELYPNDSDVKRAKRDWHLKQINNFVVSDLLRLIFDPKRYIYKVIDKTCDAIYSYDYIDYEHLYRYI